MEHLAPAKRLAGLVGLLTLLLPAQAWAGSLGDFSDSYSETESDNRETEEDDDPDNDHTNLAEGLAALLDAAASADCDDDCGSSSSSSSSGGSAGAPEILTLLIGNNPGPAFSLGHAPYAGRGERLASDIDDLADSAVANRSGDGPLPERRLDASVTDHSFQWTMRTNALVTSALDSAGGEVFGRLNSTKAPGFAFSYQYAHAFQSREQLGLSYLVYEPNLSMGTHVQTNWSIGVSHLHDGQQINDLGLAVGFNVEMFPLEPFVLNGRLNFHGFEYVTIGDLNGSLGVFVSDHLAVETNVRHLHIFGGDGLTTFGLGVRTYFGM